jgi:hypothetical protein
MPAPLLPRVLFDRALHYFEREPVMRAREVRMLSEPDLRIVPATQSFWSVSPLSRPATLIGAVPLQAEGGKIICLLGGLTSSLWLLGAVWPPFGSMLKIIGQIAVLYFKTGMRG